MSPLTAYNLNSVVLPASFKLTAKSSTSLEPYSWRSEISMSAKLRPTLSNLVRTLTLGNWWQWMQILTTSLRIGPTVDALESIARLDKPPKPRSIYGKSARLFFSFTLSLMTCILLFGGSFLDTRAAGFGAIFISIVRIFLSDRVRLYG